jgi:UDP-glucose 4-epimerase
MRCLVTGGAGFIGHHLVDRLAARGDEVIALDNGRRGLPPSKNARLITADIRDRDAVAAACAGVDVVYHLAAQSNVMGAAQDVGYSVETNVNGTINVLEAALQAGVRRVVFSSSREVYGDPSVLPVPEAAPIAPKNLYGASKAAGEAYVRAYIQRGLDCRVLRLANVYGPGDRDRVIPLWLDRARKGEELQVFGGKQVLDLIWIDTVVDALIKASEVDTLSGPVNIGAGRGTRIMDLAARVCSAVGSASRIEVLPARGEEVVGFVADVTRLRTHLGIEPPADPLAGLAVMAANA